MTSNRRAHFNYALEYAVEQALLYDVPLVIFEGLRTSYPWSSHRIHQFVIEGMLDQKVHFAKNKITYLPYVEPHENAGKGLLAALAERALMVVTDLFPTFFLTKKQKAFTSQNPQRRVVRVDSNGLMPLHHTERTFSRAYDYRRFVQKEMEHFILERPLKDPTSKPKLNREAVDLQHIFVKWDFPSLNSHQDIQTILKNIPFQAQVPQGHYRGGAREAKRRLSHFLKHHILNYHEKRNDAQAEGTSFLSPYLHFGHISAHDIFWKIMKQEKWLPTQVSSQRKGQREGFWRLSPGVEGFLDQLVVWREIGFNTCSHIDAHDTFGSLPAWSQQTLLDHSNDFKEYLYTLHQFENSQTHDDIWNAAQRQLVQEGRMHNYLRMLWGKKILEWSPSPMDALAIMIELNNKYALDGRDPNSYSGIFWVLGRYDRAWGPERPIFGKIRFMSSDATRRKLKLKTYLETYGPQTQLL
jgi:deoxyribodipyrimidine photo-lyase